MEDIKGSKRGSKALRAALSLAIMLLAGLFMPLNAQERDDLQEYLDQLAAEQAAQPQMARMKTQETVTIPVGLTEVDLSKFSSYRNRTTSLTLKTSVKFTNGTITAASTFSSDGPLLKIYDGATVVIGETAGIDASAVTMGSCASGTGMTSAVRIEGVSALYQEGDITAPSGEEGEAIHLATSADSYYHVSGTLTGTIHNPNGGTVVQPQTVTKAELLETLADIKDMLDELNEKDQATHTAYSKVEDYLSTENKEAIMERLYPISSVVEAFYVRQNNLAEQVQEEDEANYGNLKTLIDKLYTEVSNAKTELLNTLSSLVETMKAYAVTSLQTRLTALQNSVNALQTRIVNVETAAAALRTGTWFFERRATAAFTTAMSSLQQAVNTSKTNVGQLITDFNALVSGSAIATIDDVVAFALEVKALENRLQPLTEGVCDAEGLLTSAQGLYATLAVIFPTADQNYDIRPKGLTDEIQMGYKDNRGWVLTSSGMMYFEQVSGATFRLHNQDGFYLMADGTSGTKGTEDVDEATVWTGISMGDGTYVIKDAAANTYLRLAQRKVNGKVTRGEAYSWTITESDLDDLQAFLNLLAEEEELPDEPGTAPEEPIIWPVPGCTCVNYPGVVIPRTPYPWIFIPTTGGRFPIPGTQGGSRSGFIPYHVKPGSTATFRGGGFENDGGSGDYVIYVDGTLTIEIDVWVILGTGWNGFIDVRDGGHVIWKTPNTGGTPVTIHVRPGGKLTIPAGAHVGTVINDGGTIELQGGTVDNVINRGTFHFTGGLINFMDNYGTMTHDSGSILRVNNREGATYTMNGGEVNNTVVNVEVETVFVNCGTFYFYGGSICGYAKRLIYHGPNAVMRIDGGTFCFDHVTDYWIVAESDFYLPGNVNYQPTKPIYLHPTVCIHILYEWIYRIRVIFYGDRPTPRYPVFKGESGCVLNISCFNLIDWLVPSRWRWKLDDTNNTIEARDEEVVDEDDLQAYLDWLAENKDGDAQSTEEQPQVLDLKGRTITVNRIIYIPIGCHLYWKNGTVKAGNSWTGEKLFYVPEGSSLKLENLVVDFTVRTIYIVSSNVVTRWLFDIDGTVWFGQGFHVKGWLDSALQPSDGFIPGAGIRTGSTGRVYISGGRLTNVVLHLSTVLNIYILKSLAYDLYVYLPTACRRAGFRVLAPWSGFAFTLVDLSKIKFFGVPDWLPETDDEGYVSIFRAIDMGDVNNSGSVTPADAIMILYHYFAVEQTGFWLFRADMNRDGYITPADAIEALYKYFSISPARAGQPALAPGRDPE